MYINPSFALRKKLSLKGFLDFICSKRIPFQLTLFAKLEVIYFMSQTDNEEFPRKINY